MVNNRINLATTIKIEILSRHDYLMTKWISEKFNLSLGDISLSKSKS